MRSRGTAAWFSRLPLPERLAVLHGSRPHRAVGGSPLTLRLWRNTTPS